MPVPDGGVALVTGGGRGIGKAIAERLAGDGLRVVTLGRTSGDVRADVGDPASVERAFGEIHERFGPVLVLVNNAGERQDGLAIRMKADQWESVIDTNLNGAFHCTRRALDDMLGARWGRIVNISSSSAQGGQPYMTHYVSSKAGVIGLTKALALEFGPKGITVNTIPPGFIDTPMLRDSEEKGLLGEGVESNAAKTPVRRVGRPEDIAYACSFLVSEEASYVTGQVIGVNGGRNT